MIWDEGSTMTDHPDDLLNQAIAAARSGQKETARHLLVQVLQADPQSETAWLWMSAAVETRAERIHCLQQILRINPANETAIKGLRALGAPEVAAPSPDLPDAGPPAEAPPAEPEPPAGGVPLPSADAVARAQQEAEKIVAAYLADWEKSSSIRWERRG